MPRYFFDQHDGSLIRDLVGAELRGHSAATDEAISRVAAYASDPSNLRDPGIIDISVRDGHGAIVQRVTLVCQIARDPAK